MRRLWLAPLLVVAVFGAACSDDGGGGSPTTDDVTDEATDEGTDEADDEARLGTDTGDNTGGDDDDDPSDVAPTDILDSFTGQFETEIQFVESGSLVVRSDATYVDGDQDCTVITSLVDGREREERAVVVGDDAFYSDDGVGVRTDADNAEVVDTLDSCVTSASFWDGFPDRDELGDGNPADFNGIPSERYDLLEDEETFEDVLDLPPGFEGEQLDIWIADDGGWVAGASVRYSGPARACRDFAVQGQGAGEACTVRIDVRVADPDDSSLEVRLPRD